MHAPSDPTFKGTPLIEAALGKLQDRFAFDYRRVQGLAHADALQLYRTWVALTMIVCDPAVSALVVQE